MCRLLNEQVQVCMPQPLLDAHTAALVPGVGHRARVVVQGFAQGFRYDGVFVHALQNFKALGGFSIRVGKNHGFKKKKPKTMFKKKKTK